MRNFLFALLVFSPLLAQNNHPPQGVLINWNHPLARDLVGFWLFDEGSGDRVVDRSHNGNDGTLTRMVPLDDWVPGRLGGHALAFDNNDDQVNVPDDELFTIANGTWSIWFKPDQLIDSTDPVTFYFLMSMNLGGTNTGDILIFWFYDGGDDGALRFQIDDNTPTIQIINSDQNSWLQDRWYHCVVTWGSSGMMMYIDGVLQADVNTTTTGAGSAAVDLNIGSHSASTWFTFPGSIDDTRIYRRALTPDEVYSLYSDPYALFDKPFYGRVLTQAVAASVFGRRKVKIIN